MNDRRWIAALIVGVAVFVAGTAIGGGLEKFRTGDRYVTVKGVAERDVEADLALWPLRFVVSDNDLGRAQARIVRDEQRIRAFLARHGIDSAAVTVQSLDVSDALSNPYQEGPRTFRYVVNQTLIVRSDSVRLVNRASQDIGELVQAGIVLTGGYGTGPTFVFTRLNEVKPAMIREATAAAREAAQQFAADAGSHVGGIRTANQGVFVILPRDQAPGIDEGSQLAKTVRVVTTIEYYLR